LVAVAWIRIVAARTSQGGDPSTIPMAKLSVASVCAMASIIWILSTKVVVAEDGECPDKKKLASDAALIQLVAMSKIASMRCWHPTLASCFWYTGANARCCSAVTSTNFSFSNFCEECKGSENAEVAADILEACPASSSPGATFAQFGQQRVHKRHLLRMLRFGGRQQKSWGLGDTGICQLKWADCAFNLTAQTGVLFKQVERPCCEQLESMLGNRSRPIDDVDEFCTACSENNNQDVQGLVATVCSKEDSE